MAKKQQENLPADVARPDSLGGMARRLASPAHLAALCRWAGDTVRQEGFEQLWRELDFRVSLALHKDKWQHRADQPTRRRLKAQRRNPLNGPKISLVVPVYNTDPAFFAQMVASVRGQTYPNWQLVLADASDEAHPEPGLLGRRAAGKDERITYLRLE